MGKHGYGRTHRRRNRKNSPTRRRREMSLELVPETPRQFAFPPSAVSDVVQEIADAIVIAEAYAKNRGEHHANLQGNPQFWPR